MNRDPIGEAGGVNLYAFLANNPLGGYEYLGMSWLSEKLKFHRQLASGRPDKAFKTREALLDGIFGKYKNTLRGIALAFIPYVGPYLAAAYGAYEGYQAGGIAGAVVGAVGGYAGANAALAASNVVLHVAARLAISEGISMAAAAIDKRVRGFAKWFGRVMDAYTVYSGWSRFQQGFAQLGRDIAGSIGVSPQADRVSLPTPTITLGEIEVLEWDADLGAGESVVQGWIADIESKIGSIAAPAASYSFDIEAANAHAAMINGLGGAGRAGPSPSAVRQARMAAFRDQSEARLGKYYLGVAAGVGGAAAIGYAPMLIASTTGRQLVWNARVYARYTSYRAYHARLEISNFALRNASQISRISEGILEVYEGIPGGSAAATAGISFLDMVAEKAGYDLVPFTP